LNWFYLLCQFHVHQSFRKAIGKQQNKEQLLGILMMIERCTNVQECLPKISQFVDTCKSSNLSKYFEKNWFTGDCLPHWIDAPERGQRVSLRNTNNFTESGFRKITYY